MTKRVLSFSIFLLACDGDGISPTPASRFAGPGRYSFRATSTTCSVAAIVTLARDGNGDAAVALITPGGVETSDATQAVRVRVIGPSVTLSFLQQDLIRSQVLSGIHRRGAPDSVVGDGFRCYPDRGGTTYVTTPWVLK